MRSLDAKESYLETQRTGEDLPQSDAYTSSYATKWNASKGSGTLLAGAVPELPLPDMIADAATLLAHSMLHCEAISI